MVVFLTISRFSGEYLQKETCCRQSGNGVGNYELTKDFLQSSEISRTLTDKWLK